MLRTSNATTQIAISNVKISKNPKIQLASCFPIEGCPREFLPASETMAVFEPFGR